MMDVCFKNLILKRPHHPILRDFTYTIPPGNGLWVSGPNGAGKSTFLLACLGLFPFKGHIHISDQITYVGHQLPLDEKLTVQDNIHFMAKLHSYDPHYLFDIADILGQRVDKLSAGQKQKVALSCLLNPAKEVWILDEPTQSLDQDSIKLFWAYIQNFLNNKGIVIMTTHDTEIPLKDKFYKLDLPFGVE